MGFTRDSLPELLETAWVHCRKTAEAAEVPDIQREYVTYAVHVLDAAKRAS